MSDHRERQRLLLLVALHAGKISGKTKLQKLVYLVQRESGVSPLASTFHFEPYLYGPFSQDLSGEVDQLERELILARDPYLYQQKGQTMATASCELTAKGQEEARRLSERFAEESEAVRSVVERYRYEPLPRLLDHVYATYPEFAINARRD
ncbi:MAG: hypothetical protein V4510_04715 [bacterium]